MRHQLRAFLLALVVLSPAAAAMPLPLAPGHPQLDPWFNLLPSITPIVPCLVLDATIPQPDGEPRRVSYPIENAPGTRQCNGPLVEVHVDATRWSARGNVTFVIETSEYGATVDGQGAFANLTYDSDNPPDPIEPEDPRQTLDDTKRTIAAADDPVMVPENPITKLLKSVIPSEPAQSVPIRHRVIVSAAFDVAWTDGCASVKGTFSAGVDGMPLDAAAPSGLFESLCRLTTGHPGEVAPRLVQSVVAIGEALVPGVGLPELDPVVDGLALLASLLEPAPEAPDEDARVAGDATAGASTEGDLVFASGNVSASTTLLSGAPDLATGPTLSSSASSPVADASPSITRGPRAGAVAPPPAAAKAEAVARLPAIAPSPDAQPVGPARTMTSVAQPEAGRLASAIAIGVLAPVLVAVAIALYQRITKPAALRHARRAALHAACKSLGRPATTGELAALAGMPRKSAEYHLAYLARLGILRIDEDANGPRRYVLPGSAPSAPAVDLDAALLARIAAAPGESVASLAKALGVGRLRVDRRVKDLLLDGKLESRVEEGRRRLYVAQG